MKVGDIYKYDFLYVVVVSFDENTVCYRFLDRDTPKTRDLSEFNTIYTKLTKLEQYLQDFTHG
jgi:ABC-type maltose transport system permease subunit